MKLSKLLFAAAIAVALPAVATASLINEFQPNPDGADPSPQPFELIGTPNTSFDGWVISVESDNSSSLGVVDYATAVSGAFDANGLLTVDVPDFENPSFTLFLTSAFTGTVGTTDIDTNDDGTSDDVSTFGTIFDAIGIADDDGSGTTLYAAQNGGVDFPFTGTEPELMFRDGVTQQWWAINDNITPSADAIGEDGGSFPVSSFSFSPVPNTFGGVNPTAIPEPSSMLMVLMAASAVGAVGMRRRLG